MTTAGHFEKKTNCPFRVELSPTYLGIEVDDALEMAEQTEV